MNTRQLPTLILILVAMVAFSEGQMEETTTVGTTEIETLTLSYPKSASSIPILALIDEYPTDYEGAFFTDHPQALARLLNGEIDVLATGFSVGYSRFRSAGDLAHLMTPVWGASALMTAEDVDSLDALSGGVVYAPFEGSPIDVYLKAILEEAELTDTVEIDYAPFPQASALLAQGKANAAVLVEPLASRVEMQGTAYRLENLHEGWARITGGEQRSPQVSLFATDSTVGELAPELQLLRQRLTTIVEAVTADPARFANDFAPAVGFPEPVVENALRNTLFSAPDPGETRGIIEEYTRIMDLGTPDDSFYAPME